MSDPNKTSDPKKSPGTMPYAETPTQVENPDEEGAHPTLMSDAAEAKTVFGEMRLKTEPPVVRVNQNPSQFSAQKTVDSDVIAQAAPNEQTMTGEDSGPVLIDMPKMDTRGPLTAPTRLEDVGEDELGDKIRADLEENRPRREKKDQLIGELLGGRFLVIKKIGAGGMGAVYRARQEGMDRDVAVKVLLGDLSENDTVLRRFTLEALAVSRLKHPNTIQIFDYGQTPAGNPYIAMELLEGQTLHDVLRKERPLPIRRALRMMAQVAASLGEAHDKGIVHRDLKPENIFLISVSGNADFVKVLDFGVAKMRDSKDEKGTLTQAGSIFGTPRYMSPEQCSAQPVDHRSDIYALGVILFEMITGLPPFQSDQPLTLLLSHVNELPPPPSSIELMGKDGTPLRQVIPAEVEELVLKLLEKEPEDRVQTAEDLSRLCQQLAESLPTAFDARVGEAEAESLGVRLPSMHTMDFPTARTLRMNAGDAAASSAPALSPPPVKKNNALIAVVIGLVVATAAAVAVVNSGTPPPRQIVVAAPPPGTAIPEPATPPKADEVTATLTTQPPGATVLKGNEKLGVTNLTITRKKGSPPEVVQLTLPGHKTVELTLNFEQNFLQHTQLVEEAQAPQPVAVPTPGVGRPKVQGAKAELPKAEVKAETPKVEEKKPEEKKPEEKKEKKKKDEGLVEEIM